MMSYWQNKISLFLHDPVHKAIDIRNHEKNAAEIAGLLHQTAASKDQYQAPDMIAAGLTRAALPGYSSDELMNGAVDFKDQPVLTHPVIKSELKVNEKVSTGRIHPELLELLKKDLDKLDNKENLTHDEWSKKLFFYLFFALKKRLRNENIGGIGGLWDILPADTRMPDHSIWHHCSLTSAIGSSMASDPRGSVSLVVFSITPVQLFISKARKLRDAWTASVVLSYLSFTGIRKVMDDLGPDHIMYPSLHDQLLTEMWIGDKFNLQYFLSEEGPLKKHNNNSKAIASFPNKFTFLCATSDVEKITGAIQNAVQEEWIKIGGKVRDFLKEKLEAGDSFVKKFDNQISDFWKYSWASSKLPLLDDMGATASVLHEQKWKYEFDTVSKFASAFKSSEGTARLYGTAHSLVQSLLASAKFKPAVIRKSQSGEKCPLCGEHEVLYDSKETGGEEVEEFWKKAREHFNRKDSTAQIGKNEKLCAVCCIKRFLPLVMAVEKGEMLHEILGEQKKFPSTTEMAAHNYIKKVKEETSLSEDEEMKLINRLHKIELEETDDEEIAGLIDEIHRTKIKYGNIDKYYAVLLMDGDRIGDLVNGVTVSATWEDVLHPQLRERFKNSEFQKDSMLRKAGLNRKRTINPSVHAAISDSLNSFSRYGAAPVIADCKGKLIYAGGDDLLAVLPLDYALEAAEKISRSYKMKFVSYTDKGAQEIDTADSGTGKISMHLGGGPGISISGAIVIAHHKEPLREVIRDAHAVLDGIAKKRAGRNALAIRLKKRSGGDRDVSFRWDAPNPFTGEGSKGDETILDAFKSVSAAVSDSELGTRLIYKLKYLKDAVRPLINDPSFYDYDEKRWNRIDETSRERVIDVFAWEIGHSGIKIKAENDQEKRRKKRELAARLAGLCIMRPPCDRNGKSLENDDSWYNPEGPVISRFLSRKEEN